MQTHAFFGALGRRVGFGGGRGPSQRMSEEKPGEAAPEPAKGSGRHGSRRY
jgi:hypothetical protein